MPRPFKAICEGYPSLAIAAADDVDAFATFCEQVMGIGRVRNMLHCVLYERGGKTTVFSVQDGSTYHNVYVRRLYPLHRNVDRTSRASV